LLVGLTFEKFGSEEGNFLSLEPLAKFNGSFDLEAGIANFRIGLPRPTPEEGIPTLCSLQFPDF
jgi:hypothetical protein